MTADRDHTQDAEMQHEETHSGAFPVRAHPDGPPQNDELSPFGKFLVAAAGPPGNIGPGLFLMVLVIGLPYGGLLGLRHLATMLITHNLQPLLYVILGSLVFVMAVVAYRLRSSARLLYGLFELLFGILISLLAAETLLRTTRIEDVLDLQILTPIVGGMYVCIRGLNNIEEGLLPKRQMSHVTRTQRIWWTMFHKSIMFKETPAKPPSRDTILMALIAACGAAMALFALAFEKARH